MAKTPEKKVQDKIVEYLKSLKEKGHPIYLERRQAMGLGYKEGLPDLWVSYNGVHIEIECKQLEGSVRTRQEKWEREFKHIGIIYIRPDSAQEVIDLFEKEIIPVLSPGDKI